MSAFTFTDTGIKEAEEFLMSCGDGTEYTGYDAVHYANVLYAKLNPQITTMTIDEIHGIKPKENERRDSQSD